MDIQSKVQQVLTLPVAVVIAGVIIAGAIFWTNKSAPSVAQSPQPTTTGVDIRDVDTAGEPFIGNPNAPVTMAYWYDYQCPFCQRHELQVMPEIIKDYVDTGKVKIVFKDYQFLGPDSQTLGRYSTAVWDAAPQKFYAWHKAVYDNQGVENTGWATQEKILSITRGVLGTDTDRVVQLVTKNGERYQQEMDKDKQEGATLGINGTPGVIVGKELIPGALPYAQFKAAIELALAAK